MKPNPQSNPTAESYANLGRWYADQKQFECAADAFSYAARLQPASASLFYFWGLSLQSAGNTDAALEPLRRAVELDPGDIRPHLALAAALDKMKQTTNAESEWRKALAIDANSSIARDGLSQDLVDRKDFTAVVTLLDKPNAIRQRSPLESLNLGIAFANTARLEDAASVLREAFNTYPDSLPIADELAMVLMLQSKVDEADGVFGLALQKHPGDHDTQILYLRTMVSSHSEKAPAYAQKLLGAYPNQWEVLYLNAMVASGEGDFQRTRDLVARSVALNPKNPASQHLFGAALAKLGDLSNAKEHLQTAIELGDDSPEVHYELAKVFQRLGDAPRAEEQLQSYHRVKDAQSNKSQAAGKAEVADAEMKAGNPDKAASLYREALESDPDEPLLFYKLSRALEKTNDLAGEKEALKRAIALNPALPEAQNQLGYLALHQGDAVTAERYFRAAIQASPSYVVAWTNLAATLASESKVQDARDAVAHALAIDPDNAQARQLRDILDSAGRNP